MPVTHDKDLRARVKLFGNLLGEVLRTQESGQVLDVVETLRKGFIELRSSEDPARRAQLMALIEALDPQTLTHVLRAFSTYFILANIAEEDWQHQERRLRVASGEPLWRGSFDDTVRELVAAGVSAEQMQGLLDSLLFQPVFTAHVECEPGVFARGETGSMLDRLGECLKGHFDVEHSTFQLEPAGRADSEEHAHR